MDFFQKPQDELTKKNFFDRGSLETTAPPPPVGSGQQPADCTTQNTISAREATQQRPQTFFGDSPNIERSARSGGENLAKPRRGSQSFSEELENIRPCTIL